MESSSVPDDPGAVLTAIRTRREAEEQAARDVLILTARFAEQHHPDAIHPPATEATTLVGDRGLPLAGEGAPEVSEFAVMELGATLGMSSHAAKKLVGDVLELVHRLPKTWTRIHEGTLVAYRLGLRTATARRPPLDQPPRPPAPRHAHRHHQPGTDQRDRLTRPTLSRAGYVISRAAWRRR